ncbi:MliC family protein [Rhodanobacter sp. TND4FH1]
MRRISLCSIPATCMLLALSACSSPPAAHPSARKTDICHASQLSLRLDGKDGEFNGMSHSGTMLIVRNNGATSCTIPALPVPRFVDANGQSLEIVAHAAIPAVPELPPLVLAPGASVESEMRWISGNVYDGGHCESPAQIALPLATEKISSAFTGHLCGAAGSASTYTLKPFRPMPPPVATAPAETVIYTCDDGRSIEVAYPHPDTALLTLDGRTLQLKIARSADGARYADEHWQWWTKGMHEARLAPLKQGETIASAPGVSCQAR